MGCNVNSIRFLMLDERPSETRSRERRPKSRILGPLTVRKAAEAEATECRGRNLGLERNSGSDMRDGWRRNDWKGWRDKQGRSVADKTAFMPEEGPKSCAMDLRASVVVMNWGNAQGAKGRRKVKAIWNRTPR